MILNVGRNMYKDSKEFMHRWLCDVQRNDFAKDCDTELEGYQNKFLEGKHNSNFALGDSSMNMTANSNLKLSPETSKRATETAILNSSLGVEGNACSTLRECTNSMKTHSGFLADELEEYYEEQVQESLDRKNTCEDIAYSVAHKLLRKVQTVDDRFRANSLVPHGIPYDGLKADEPIYFEMIVQLCIGEHNTIFMKREKDSPFSKIQLMSSNDWEDCLTAGGFLSASKVQHVLRRYTKQAVHVLRKYISQGKREKIPEKLFSLYLEEGPTITLTINDDIRVRILPALSVPDYRTDLSRKDCPSSSHVISVPRIAPHAGIFPFVDGSPCHVTREDGYETVWRLSFFVAEKNKMRALGSGCRIQLLRTLTNIRDNNSVLKPLSAYHLKTVLLHECNHVPDPYDWQQQCLSERFLGLLGRLKGYLSKGLCPHYFMSPPEYPEINLFYGIDSNDLEEMAKVVQEIIDSPTRALWPDVMNQRSSPWPWELEGRDNRMA